MKSTLYIILTPVRYILLWVSHSFVFACTYCLNLLSVMFLQDSLMLLLDFWIV
jgi:hypothetical protein